MCEMILIWPRPSTFKCELKVTVYCVAETSPTFCDAAFKAVRLRTSARSVNEIINDAAISPANT